MTPEYGGDTFVSHLEALRRMLLRQLGGTALLYVPGFLLAPYAVDLLVRWCFPAGTATLHYFSPMEVFLVELKLALVLALVLAAPWNLHQLWKFLLPALYRREKRLLRWYLFAASLLFLTGAAFCTGVILPLVMQFALSFATPQLQPILGLGAFLELAGWLILAFGVMFQMPVLVMIGVRFGVVKAATLARSRPYVVVGILILAAVLTPPDVVSQLLLAVPTWILFELGLFAARKWEKK